jgi:hypothetical protein
VPTNQGVHISTDGANYFSERGISSFTNPMTTKGDVIVGAASGVPARLPVGANGQVLTANSSATDGLDWETQPIPVGGMTIDVNGSVVASGLLTVNVNGSAVAPGLTIIDVNGSAVALGVVGTVISIGLTMPTEFSVAGSPITSSGTLAVTKANQSANLVYAGPSSGSPAAPTFRSLAAGDLPLATTGASGAVKPDGSTITISSGVISASGGGMTLIASNVLGSAAATVTFTSIPGTYKNLRIVWGGRSSQTSGSQGGQDYVIGQFNGDTGANYDFEGNYFQGNGIASTNVSAFNGLASASPQIGYLAGNGAPANTTGCFDTYIPNYAGTTFYKNAFSVGGDYGLTTTSGFQQINMFLTWHNTAAITSILFKLGSGLNFMTGSWFYLYGY